MYDTEAGYVGQDYPFTMIQLIILWTKFNIPLLSWPIPVIQEEAGSSDDHQMLEQTWQHLFEEYI